MSKQLLRIIALGAACAAMSVCAQDQSDKGPGRANAIGPNDPYQGQNQNQSQTGVLSPTGRMEQHPVRASKLMGAQVKSASGEELGTINDVILNPTTGRIEFGVLALTPSAGAAGSAEKLAAVPWSLLRSSMPAGYSTTSTAGTPTTGANTESFVFSGDHTKLQQAPSFDQNSWPDISTPQWRQSIYSFYGVRPGAAMGGSRFPEGIGTGAGQSTTPSTTTPQTPPRESNPGTAPTTPYPK